MNAPKIFRGLVCVGAKRWLTANSLNRLEIHPQQVLLRHSYGDVYLPREAITSITERGLGGTSFIFHHTVEAAPQVCIFTTLFPGAVRQALLEAQYLVHQRKGPLSRS